MRQSYRDELHSKKRKRVIYKFVALGFVFLVIIVSIFYLLFFARIFDIRNVNTSGLESIAQSDFDKAEGDWLNKKTLGISRRDNLLFISSDKLSSYLRSQFPKIETIKIEKKLAHVLNITITERKSVGIWCLPAQAGTSTGVCFYFDKDGIAYAPTSVSTGFLITVINDNRNKNIVLGSSVSDPIWFKNILLAKEELAKIKISVSRFTIPADSFDEFYTVTSEGWKVLFSNSTDITKQISSLAVFLRDKLTTAKRASIQYVDLKIQDRIYYK